MMNVSKVTWAEETSLPFTFLSENTGFWITILASCGTGVTKPTSTKPKPIPSKPSTAFAFLSKPAERLIELFIFC